MTTIEHNATEAAADTSPPRGMQSHAERKKALDAAVRQLADAHAVELERLKAAERAAHAAHEAATQQHQNDFDALTAGHSRAIAAAFQNGAKPLLRRLHADPRRPDALELCKLAAIAQRDSQQLLGADFDLDSHLRLGVVRALVEEKPERLGALATWDAGPFGCVTEAVHAAALAVAKGNDAAGVVDILGKLESKLLAATQQGDAIVGEARLGVIASRATRSEVTLALQAFEAEQERLRRERDWQQCQRDMADARLAQQGGEPEGRDPLWLSAVRKIKTVTVGSRGRFV